MSPETFLDLLEQKRTRPHHYSEDYKNAVFYTWYRLGKLGAQSLRGRIETFEEHLPSDALLKTWINSDAWKAKTKELDDVIKTTVENKVITEKIEMLTRHAETGKEMQNIALDYLRENKANLKVNNAIRLLFEGIETERKSRGLPTLITETLEKTDEDLLAGIEKLMTAIDAGETEMNDVEQLSDL